jgi:hypothetical protein
MLRSLAIVGALSLALLPPVYLGVAYPVNAQEASECVTIAKVQADAAAANAELVGGATFRGKNLDEMLVFQTAEVILAFYFKDGCYVTMQPVDQVVPEKDA